jgi:hypothetical protein
MRTVQCIALACLVALAVPASAQTPTDKVKFEVSRAELQMIGQGLMELPYKTAAPVLNGLQAQLNAADAAAAKVAADAKAAEAKPAEKPTDKPAE